MGKKLTLTDKIYHEIKDDINGKVFQPGEKLNIKELARKYDVSDTPVKQALHPFNYLCVKPFHYMPFEC